MHTSTISFDAFNQLKDAAAHERIRAARARLGKKAVLLCHHYQRADVYQYADLTGDSLKLSRLASQTDSEYIVFCGVHFMAEVADIMSRAGQIAILPDLAAGCSMADMASLAKVERCWRELNAVLGDADSAGHAGHLHQLGGRSEGLLRRPRRYRMHLVECRHHPGSGPLPGARRSCSSPTSTLAAGPATRWAFRSTRWWCGIRIWSSAA
jgi:hypothetical protein